MFPITSLNWKQQTRRVRLFSTFHSTKQLISVEIRKYRACSKDCKSYNRYPKFYLRPPLIHKFSLKNVFYVNRRIELSRRNMEEHFFMDMKMVRNSIKVMAIIFFLFWSYCLTFLNKRQDSIL